MFWQSMVRNWIVKTAKERLYEEVARTQGAQDDGLPRERACDVGLVFALPVERGAMEDRLDGVVRIESAGLVARQGGLRGRHVMLVDSGMGMERARRATELLIAGHRPEWIVSAGLSGGLVAELQRGDLVVAESVVDEAGGMLTIELPAGMAEWLTGRKAQRGRMLTIDRIADTPAEKRTLGERHQALSVDCETYAVGEACRAAGTKFLAVRVVLDEVEDRLPDELLRLSRTQGGVRRAGGLVGAVWNRPGSVKEMFAWQERSLTAADRLAKFLTGLVAQLVEF
ncbi:MAG: hypothetical protein KF708_18270 [Pirellulales bacterium]|nr:hypothetical protein [Pirellulales bacterium]